MEATKKMEMKMELETPSELETPDVSESDETPEQIQEEASRGMFGNVDKGFLEFSEAELNLVR